MTELFRLKRNESYKSYTKPLNPKRSAKTEIQNSRLHLEKCTAATNSSSGNKVSKPELRRRGWYPIAANKKVARTKRIERRL